MSRLHHKHYYAKTGLDVTDLFTPPAERVDTSREAAARIQGHTNRIRAAILLWLKTQGSQGATAGEITVALGLNPSTVRPRLRELEGNAKWAEGLPRRIVKTVSRRDGMRVYQVLAP